MKQTRLMSLIEAIANVVVGYGVAVLTQLIVFPWFGLPARIGDAMAIGLIFTGVSIAPSFLLRRLFEAIRVHDRGVSRLRASGPFEPAPVDGNGRKAVPPWAAIK